jgi:hypothetical protein
MRNKKKLDTEKSSEELALEERVDAMMDPKKPDKVPAENLPMSAEKPAMTSPPTSNDAKTAPQLSAKLSKQITVAEVPTKPLSIDKLDALTESIDEPKTSGKKDSLEASEPIDPVEPAQQDDITDKSTELDDNRTEKAVDDIVAHEGDVMLAVEDATAAERNRKVTEASGQESEHHPFKAFMWILVIIIVIAAIAFFGFLFTGGNLPKLPKL